MSESDKQEEKAVLQANAHHEQQNGHAANSVQDEARKVDVATENVAPAVNSEEKTSAHNC